MFCKRKFELEIIYIDKQTFSSFVAIITTVLIERLKSDVRCNIHNKPPYKNLKQKLMKYYQTQSLFSLK